jgi:hypothetical protein
VHVRNQMSKASHATFGEIGKKRAKRMKPLPRNVKDWPLLWKEKYEERAGIMQFQGNLTRDEAERCAEDDIRKIAGGAA